MASLALNGFTPNFATKPAALYAQGKVRHVGHFAELERQYCLFSTAGYMGTRSPDRADAAIWGLIRQKLHLRSGARTSAEHLVPVQRGW